MTPSMGWYASVAFFLTVCAKTAVCLRCYHCESGVGDDACDDYYDKHDDSTANQLVECGNPDQICFKTVNRIVDPNVNKEYKLTTRGCTNTTLEDGCNAVPTASAGKYSTCYCRSEKCNSATSGRMSVVIIAAAAVMAAAAAAAVVKH